MRRALLALAAMAAGSGAALLAPWPVAVALWVLSLAVMRRGRPQVLAFTAMAAAFQAVLFGLLVGQGASWDAAGLRFYPEGAIVGIRAAIRLSAVLGVNLAALSWMPAPRILDALPMSRRGRAFLGAVLIAVQDLRDEAARIVQVRRLEGMWPERRLAQVRAAAGAVPAVLVAAERRARIRQEALRLAGIHVGPRFAPLVAVTALAIVGRMVFLAVPNITPTFLFVFLGGLLFGPLVGAAAGALSMALTDALVSGLLPSAYANVPAMALLGLAGGLARPLLRAPPAVVAWCAACLGIVVTLMFSVAADTATWLIVAEARTTPGAWRALVVGGLVFNVLPAVANGLLFATAVGPVADARSGMRPTLPVAQAR